MARNLDVDVSANGVRFERTLKGTASLAKSWANQFKGAIIAAFGAGAIKGIFSAAGAELKSLGDEASKVALPIDQMIALRDIAADSKQKVDELTGAIEALNKARLDKKGNPVLEDLGIDSSMSDDNVRNTVFKDIRSMTPQDAGKVYGDMFTAKQIEAIRKAGSSIEDLSGASNEYSDEARKVEDYNKRLIELERQKLEIYMQMTPLLEKFNAGLIPFLKLLNAKVKDTMDNPGKTAMKHSMPVIGQLMKGYDAVKAIYQISTAKGKKKDEKPDVDESGPIREGMMQGIELRNLLEKDTKNAQDEYKKLDKETDAAKKDMAKGAFDEDLSVDGGFLGKNLGLVSEQNYTFQELQKKVADNTAKMVELLNKIANQRASLKMEEWQP